MLDNNMEIVAALKPALFVGTEMLLQDLGWMDFICSGLSQG